MSRTRTPTPAQLQRFEERLLHEHRLRHYLSKQTPRTRQVIAFGEFLTRDQKRKGQ